MAMLERNDSAAVAHLTMTRPQALNALSDGLLDALNCEFDRLAKDSSINVITLSGAGKAFCAGHDLKEMQSGRQAEDKGEAYNDAPLSNRVCHSTHHIALILVVPVGWQAPRIVVGPQQHQVSS